MSKTKVRVYVTLKNGVLDPQGKAIENSLNHMGFFLRRLLKSFTNTRTSCQKQPTTPFITR